MKYYVISDPHGFYDETMNTLVAAGYFADTGEKKLLLLGDLLDRGEQPNEIVRFMIEEDKAGRLIYVTGNHEDLMDNALSEINDNNDVRCASAPWTHHYGNGTWNTILLLSGMSESEADAHPRALVQMVRSHDFYRYLRGRTVDYFETEHYVFTHGFIPCNAVGYPYVVSATYMENWREAAPEEWRRARWYNGMQMCGKFGLKIPGKTVVVGHWRASYGHHEFEGRCPECGEGADYTPYYGDGIIAIDACTKISGFVNCIVLED